MACLTAVANPPWEGPDDLADDAVRQAFPSFAVHFD
jgi:hypothetical protein